MGRMTRGKGRITRGEVQNDIRERQNGRGKEND